MGCAKWRAGAPKDPRILRGPTLGQTRAQPFGKIGAGAWLVFVSTSPRVSAPLARCAREAAPFSLNARHSRAASAPASASAYAVELRGVFGWRWWCSRWLRSSCVAGVFPRSPLGVAGYARGGRPSVARPPAGPSARAPWALSPSVPAIPRG